MPTPTGGDDFADRIPPDELKRRLQKALGADFLVDRLIGEGGFALVFAAQDRRLARRVAIKVLRPELTTSPSTVKRFVREAELAASLNHPHILPIFFVGEGEGLVYFGMPYVEGETLDGRLGRERQLPEAEVVRIGAAIADALAEAHAAGLVHRDVKPANVLLQGSKARVLVADFGIAKAAGASGKKLTRTGSVIGSPHYMSPEQASGSDHVDARSDTYSLGVVLWQMLAGAPPFDAKDAQGILIQHLTQPLPALAKRRPGVSPALVKIIERCCSKQPEHRYQSVAEVGEALRSGQAPVAAKAGRRRFLVDALVVAAIAVVIALVMKGKSGPTAGRTGGAVVTDSAPRSAAPLMAVLPFEVDVRRADSSSLARRFAGMLADRMESMVRTVDKNRLLDRWGGGRSLIGLDSSMALAYGMGANQAVVGSIYEDQGHVLRISADVYDTRQKTMIGHRDIAGSSDSSLFDLAGRLASLVATALCSQPGFNPQRLCYDTGARPRTPLRVGYTPAPGRSVPASVSYHVLVSPEGSFANAEPADSAAGEFLGPALQVLRSAAYEPARRGRAAVEAWSMVAVSLQSITTPAADTTTGVCATSAGSIISANHCWDTRPVPRQAPQLRAPSTCTGAVTPALVLANVVATGEVSSASLNRPSNCRDFDAAAVAQVQDMRFTPASKSGSPVAAWVIVLMRATP